MSQMRQPGSSPSSQVYMPSSPPLEPKSIVSFQVELKAKFAKYLATKPPTTPTRTGKRCTNNCRIFS
jgi:hypothetical protein